MYFLEIEYGNDYLLIINGGSRRGKIILGDPSGQRDFVGVWKTLAYEKSFHLLASPGSKRMA